MLFNKRSCGCGMGMDPQMAMPMPGAPMMGPGCGCPCSCPCPCPCPCPSSCCCETTACPVECPADQVMDPPVERVVRRDVIHNVQHIATVNTRVINNHIFRHTVVPQFTCCEENVCCNPCCEPCCNPCCDPCSGCNF